MRRLLVLRPEPGATATVKRAQAIGLETLARPLFEIHPVDWQAPDPALIDALLLTSASAVRFAGEQLNLLRALPVYAVGEATAAAAREAGLGLAATGDGGVEALLSSIPATIKLLHLCGEDRKAPETARHEITPVIVYRSVDRQADLADVGDCVALIHSPRAGRRFAELTRDRSSIAIVAISADTADALGTGWRSVDVAEARSDKALLALAARLCNSPHPQ